jgi:hypothetical protein
MHLTRYIRSGRTEVRVYNTGSSQRHITADGQSISLDVIIDLYDNYGLCLLGTPSLTRGWVCHLSKVSVSGFSIHDGTLLHSKKSTHYSLTQSATLRTHVDVRPARSRNAHSYRILPTGHLVAIFQHSLPFLESEGF